MKMKPRQNDSSFVGAFLTLSTNNLYLFRGTAAYWLVLSQFDTHMSLVVTLFVLNCS